jgi:glycogen synthase
MHRPLVPLVRLIPLLMEHLIVCREYPPAPSPPGGIGTYVKHLAKLLAEAGEIVHVIAQRWEGAPQRTSESHNGRLVIHRVSLDEAVAEAADADLLEGLASSDCPSQVFAWQTAKVAESLIRTEEIGVVEGPEWEAPLYYLQVRRAVGLGPAREPPCLVHLHSPSELIFRHNGWDVSLTDFAPLRRFEEYTVHAADALICPSRHLAREARELFGLADLDIDLDIEVIPYPMGNTAVIERKPDVWQRNVFCYTGRLELRKGVVEWVDAAIEAAHSHPHAIFEFIGGDTFLNGGAGAWVSNHLKARIPRALLPRFRFRGSQSREMMLESLSRASVAVIPSRWENLPYSCIEAMSTGLPVLVSPNGGMAELVVDGKSGWIAPSGSAPGLLSALRRVLDTPADKRADMGHEAAQSVRRICGNESVLERHIELRTRLASKGSGRPLSVPASTNARSASTAPPRRGVGIVVTCLERPDLLPGCLASIRDQTVPADKIVVVLNERHRFTCETTGIESFPIAPCPVEAARKFGFRRLLDGDPELRAVVFVNENVRLQPQYVGTAESVFDRQPQVGLMFSILAYEGCGNRLEAPPSPDWSSAVRDCDAIPCVAVRAEAFLSTVAGAEVLAEPRAERWTAVTYPDVLVSAIPAGHANASGSPKRYSAMAIAQHGSGISLQWLISSSMTEKARSVRRALTQPRQAAQWLTWRLNGRARRSPRRSQ